MRDMHEITKRSPPPGPATILLVEDEEGVRGMLRKLLLDHGYTVIVACDGIEALQAAAGYEGHIDLLLTDVVMPQMSGPALLKRLLDARSDLRVIYMSGHAENAIVHHGVLDPDIAFIQKPCPLEDVLRKVREVLDAPPPRR